MQILAIWKRGKKGLFLFMIPEKFNYLVCARRSFSKALSRMILKSQGIFWIFWLLQAAFGASSKPLPGLKIPKRKGKKRRRFWSRFANRCGAATFPWNVWIPMENSELGPISESLFPTPTSSRDGLAQSWLGIVPTFPNSRSFAGFIPLEAPRGRIGVSPAEFQVPEFPSTLESPTETPFPWNSCKN